MECLTPEKWISGLDRNDKVLLINPPVQEVRYAWVRWNQPSDLLLLSTKLKTEVECEVEMVDFMLPAETGRVPLRDLAKHKTINPRLIQWENPRIKDAKPTTFKARTYGMPMEEAKRNLEMVLQDWTPTQIVITSLTSYWFEPLVALLPYLRTLVPSAKITLMGAYPVTETNHAMRLQPDNMLTEFFAFEDTIPDFNLYYQKITKQLNSEKVLGFGGLKFTKSDKARNLLRQVKSISSRGIRDFVIFEDNLFAENCSIMTDFLSLLEKEDIRINLHGLCGLQIAEAVDEIYIKMFKGGFKSFFLEYDLDALELNLDSYRRAYLELYANTNIRINSGSIAGFLMIGTPQDDLERMFKHSFNLLELCGSIIPKPYTPSPGTDAYETISKARLDFLSPHVFPMAELTGITREDYLDFYKHTTFLNEKRMGTSFNFFDDRYSSVALRRSLGKKGGQHV